MTPAPPEEGLPPRTRRAENLVVLALLIVVAAITYGPYIVEGGFIADDWANAEWTRFGGPDDSSTLEWYWSIVSFRPVLVLYIPLTHAVLGLSEAAHVGLSMSLAVASAFLFYLVLRLLHLGAWAAAVPSVLSVTFPFADSIRLWIAANGINFALVLYFAGLALGLRAVSRHRARSWLHLPSLLLYALSILTYEIAAPAIALSGVAYVLRTRKLSWPLALRAGADVAVVAALTLLVTTKGPNRAQDGSFSPSYLVDRLELFGRQGLSVLGSAALPHISTGQAYFGLLTVVALGATALVAWRVPLPASMAPQLRRAVALGIAGLAVAAIGYAGFVPAASMYYPVSPGVGNRVNVAAAFGYCMVLAGLATALGTLLAVALRRSTLTATLIAAALAAIVLAGFVEDTRRNTRLFIRSDEVQATVLDAIRTTTPRPSAGLVVFVFDYPVTTGPNIPTFALSNDLRGAVRIAYDRQDITAMPVRPDVPLTCSPGGIQLGDSAHPEFLTNGAYGRTRFVDVGRRRAIIVGSRAQCERLRGSYVAGPQVDPTL